MSASDSSLSGLAVCACAFPPLFGGDRDSVDTVGSTTKTSSNKKKKKLRKFNLKAEMIFDYMTMNDRQTDGKTD